MNNTPPIISQNSVKTVNDYHLLWIPLLSIWQGNSVSRDIGFHINDPCTLFLYNITPWHQLFYACGRIHIIRHIQQYRLLLLAKVVKHSNRLPLLKKRRVIRPHPDLKIDKVVVYCLLTVLSQICN